MKKKLTRILCAAVILALLICWFPPVVRTEAAGGTLKVYVAYWGQNYAEPILKKTYSRSELSSLGVVSVQYTAYDKGNRCAYADAEGVLLTDVLYGAGIDFWDADSLHFYTTDEPTGYNNPYGIGSLFQTRYSFPLLSKYYGSPDGFYDAENPDATEEEIIEFLWTQCESVPAILALRDNYSRVDNYTEFDGGELSDSHSFRLLFGQTYPNQNTASQLAYDIESIVVLYDHYPELVTEDTELNLTRDAEGYRIVVNLADSNVDQALLEDVLSSLQWTSSDPSVVMVDNEGNLTICGEGTATISVTSSRYYGAGGARLTLPEPITVTVGDDEEFGNDNGEGGGDGDGVGDGSGTGEGTGDGSGTGEGDGEDEGSGTGGEDAPEGNEGQEGGSETGQEPTEPSEPEAPSEPDTPAETEGPPDSETGSESDAPQETVPAQDEAEDIPEATEGEASEEETPTEATQPKDDVSNVVSPGVEEEDEDEEDEELYISDEPDITDIEPDPVRPEPPQPQIQTLSVERLLMKGEQDTAKSAESSGYEGGSHAAIYYEENPLMIFTACIAALLFLLGGMVEYILFRREF